MLLLSLLLFIQEYEFDLTCKTGIGREFKIHCRAVGVLPPLELSHSVIKMKATAVSDTCSAHIEVINSHTSANEFTHPVPRIGSGPIVEVGPTSFEFVVPAGAPLTVSPAVGTVNPGEVRCSKFSHEKIQKHRRLSRISRCTLTICQRINSVLCFSGVWFT